MAVQDEGLTDVTDILNFYKEGIKATCNSVINTGGMKYNPNNAKCRITNPGVNIPVISKKS